MTFKQFIIQSLKPYIGKEIKVTVKERVWDTYLRDWNDKEILHTGTYKGIAVIKGYDMTIDNEYDILKMKLITKEGKSKTIKIDMNNTNIELPKL